MSDKYLCMVMRLNLDCNACCRKLTRIIFNIKAIETHLIEKDHHRVSVCGRFTPSDVAIKIRKRMNRRVQIIEIQDLEPPSADPPQDQTLGPVFPPSSLYDQIQNPIFPSLDLNETRRPIFPSLAANHCRSFSSSTPDFAVTSFPQTFDDMSDGFWHYGFEFLRNRDCAFYA